MSDQQQPKQVVSPQFQSLPVSQGKTDPYIAQMLDSKFQSLDYEGQQDARASLYLSKMKGNPAWDNAPDEQKIRVLKTARTMYPPAFSDPKFDQLRQDLENPSVSQPLRKFVYSQGVQMGLTGVATRGIVNAARAFSDAVAGVENRVGQFFGAKAPVAQEDDASLLMRAMGGDKDGVKLAQYLQHKYERPVVGANAPVVGPLIGGQTATQLLGSALGYGTDLLSMKGGGEIIEGAGVLSKAAPLVKLGVRAGVTGLQGVIRGEVAGAINQAHPEKAPIEGAVDFAHGTAATVKSVGTLWGAWAAQDLAFGMLGQGVTAGIRQVGKTFLRSTFGAGSKALPSAGAFEKTADGAYTPRAEALQKQFVSGNISPGARSQLGPVAQDWFQSLEETYAYSRLDPKALLDNPVASWRVGLQYMREGQNTPLGLSAVSDGPGTWRLRDNLARGGKVLGEHLSFPEAEMTSFGQWEDALATARSRYSKWEGRFEEHRGIEDMREMQSAQLRLNALQDSSPHYRMMRDSLTIVEGNLNRLSPQGAARSLSEGAMLSYGEVGQVQGLGMKVAKTRVDLSNAALSDIAKRGQLINSDAPTRFAPASAGDYNAAIVYSKAAGEQAWQVAQAKGVEFAKRGAEASPQDLAYWYLRDNGFDAIQHADGSVTALYPRQQVKHVSDFVNKYSREYTTPPKGETFATPSLGLPEKSEVYSAPSMLSSNADKANWLMEAAYREGDTSIRRLPDGNYSLQIRGSDPVVGDLPTVIDSFLLQNTTPAHLRASLESEGMKLRIEDGKYSILDEQGRELGSGANPQEAMTAAKYRPRLLDGRFGPQNVEVLPDGSKFEYTPQGIRGSLSDVYKYASSFMDVAEEEARTPLIQSASGRVSLGHDGAYTVEVPSWGIREKFASRQEATDYLGGRYRDYTNVQRLANERGFAFSYDPKTGYSLSDATGTYAVHSIDDAGKILSRTGDPRWAPGGQFDGGSFAIKDSADATRLGSDVMPRKTFYDRGTLGKTISSAKSFISNVLFPVRHSLDRAARVYGLGDLGLSKLQDSIKSEANQSFLDGQKALSIMGNYRLDNTDWIAVDKVMGALGEEAKQRTLADLGYKEGSPKRPAILNAAERLKQEFYNPLHTRTGQNPDIMLIDYATKVREFKQKNPQEYQDMELRGPQGMSDLLRRMYGGRVPDDMRFQALHERVADVEMVTKEENAIAKAIWYSRMANRWTYTAENMKAFAKRLYEPDVPQDVRVLGQHFLDEAMSPGQSDAADMIRAMGRQSGAQAHMSAVGAAQTLAGAGLYGFKPGTGLHIVQNTYTLGSGFIGTEAMNNGFRISNEGGLAHLEEQFRSGVFTGRLPVGYGFGNAQMGSGWLAGLISKIGNGAAYFVKNGHILAKSAMYDGASWLFDKHLKSWFDAGKLGDWTEKQHAIRAYHLDQDAMAQVERLLSAGDYAGARHAYAQNLSDQATFMWRPEDQGLALNSGVVSKMYGQLMVLPTSYTAALTRMASRGTFLDRAANLTAYAKNTAALYAANRAAGLSGNNLLPWNIVTLRGGPVWQSMIALTSSQQPGSNGLKTAEKALGSFFPSPQIMQAVQVVKELEGGNAWAAFLTANGFSVRPDLKPPKR